MEQSSFLPLWADDMNLWFVENDGWSPVGSEQMWQAAWIEHKFAQEAASSLRWCYDHYRKKPSLSGAWFSSRLVGRFLCLRRVPQGPIYKLSEWDLLEPGQSILLDPEPNDTAISKAENRADYMRSCGRGRFAVEHRDDGTLWVAKLS